MANETVINNKRNINVGVLSRVLKAHELKKLIKQYDDAPRLRGTSGKRHEVTKEEEEMFDRHLNFRGSMSSFAEAEKLNPTTISSRLHRIAYALYVRKVRG